MENKITIQEIAEAIKTKRPDLEVTINEVIKNKQHLQGLTIKSPSVNIAPNIYVDSYIEHFHDVDSIATAILNTYEEHKCLDGFNPSDLLNKDFILSHVIPVMQQQSDEPLIKMPDVSEKYQGAEAYLAVVSDAKDNASFSIKLNPQILASANISIEDDKLFEHALENLKEQVVISSMFDTLKEMTGITCCDEPMPFPDNMYVITTKSKCKGASAILCDDILMDFAKTHGIKGGFWLIPSSIHEALIVFGDNLDKDTLTQMVCEVNATQLQPVDILSNQAWYYPIS